MNQSTCRLKGKPVVLEGKFLEKNSVFPDSTLPKGAKIVIYTVPSPFTPTCHDSSKELNHLAKTYPDVNFIVMSAESPFALDYLSKIEDWSSISLVSKRDEDFFRSIGTLIAEGPLRGYSARAVFVLDEKHVVRYAKLSEDIAERPDFKSALQSIS